TRHVANEVDSKSQFVRGAAGDGGALLVVRDRQPASDSFSAHQHARAYAKLTLIARKNFNGAQLLEVGHVVGQAETFAQQILRDPPTCEPLTPTRLVTQPRQLDKLCGAQPG